MTTVEIVYDRDCPNVVPVRRHMLEAFGRVGLRPHWIEWARDAADSPHRVRALGSPTILIDGRDVGVTLDAGSPSCRLYPAASGHLSGVPSVDAIEMALRHGERSSHGPSAVAAAAPAFGLALLPKLTCPLCWPAYSAALSAVGFGFFDYTPYLLPLSIVSIAALLGVLAWRARRTGRVMPLLIGTVGAALMLGAKFALESDPLAFAGGAGLVLAALWPQRRGAVPCPACVAVSPEKEPR